VLDEREESAYAQVINGLGRTDLSAVGVAGVVDRVCGLDPTDFDAVLPIVDEHRLDLKASRATAARIIWVAAINYCDAAWVDEAYLPGAGGPASAPPSRRPLDAFPDDFPALGLPSGFDITQILLVPGLELFVGVESPSADPAGALISSMQEAGWTIVDWALLSNGLTSIGLEHTASGITGALSVYPGADGSTIFGTWLLPG
jgi:hypothetical protein